MLNCCKFTANHILLNLTSKDPWDVAMDHKASCYLCHQKSIWYCDLSHPQDTIGKHKTLMWLHADVGVVIHICISRMKISASQSAILPGFLREISWAVIAAWRWLYWYRLDKLILQHASQSLQYWYLNWLAAPCPFASCLGLWLFRGQLFREHTGMWVIKKHNVIVYTRVHRSRLLKQLLNNGRGSEALFRNETKSANTILSTHNSITAKTCAAEYTVLLVKELAVCECASLQGLTWFYG